MGIWNLHHATWRRHGEDMQSQKKHLLHLKKLLLRLYCNKWNKHSAASNWQTLRNEMQRFLIKANTIVARTEMHHKSLSSRFRKRVKIRKWEHCESHLGQNSFRLRFETRNVVTTFHNLPQFLHVSAKHPRLHDAETWQCGALPFRFQCLQFNFNSTSIVFVSSMYGAVQWVYKVYNALGQNHRHRAAELFPTACCCQAVEHSHDAPKQDWSWIEKVEHARCLLL